jgi:peroxiredoxin
VSEPVDLQEIRKAAGEHAARLAAMRFPDALRSGDRAPNFELPNARGERVRLVSLLERGPVVLVFYRGAWCPFCNTQLRTLQEVLAEIQSLGATLVAVSPQQPDTSAALVEDAGLCFEVLSDVGSYVASDYGITFELSAEDRSLFLAVGNDLANVNGADSWVLPAPSTYVVAGDGVIEYARVDPDFTKRPDVHEVLAVLAAVSAR